MLFMCFAATVEILEPNLYIQNGIEGQSYHLSYVDGSGFQLTTDNEKFDIKSQNVRGLPANITSAQLESADLYFQLNPNGENSTLEANARLRGGSHHKHHRKHWWEVVIQVAQIILDVANAIDKHKK